MWQSSQLLSVEVTIRDLFSYPVVARFAERLVLAELELFEPAELEHLIRLLN